MFNGSAESCEQRIDFCLQYARSQGAFHDQTSPMRRCANSHSWDVNKFNITKFSEEQIASGVSWYTDTQFVALEQERRLCRVTLGTDVFHQTHTSILLSVWEVIQQQKSLPTVILYSILFTLVVAIVLSPIWPGLLHLVLALAGPAWYLSLAIVMLEYRVFGPLTQQTLLSVPFVRDHWERMTTIVLGLNLMLVLLYDELRSLMHRYYKGRLRMNFFDQGEDLSMVDLACLPSDCHEFSSNDSADGSRAQENKMYPFYLVTGTVNDYKWPGEPHKSSAHTELSFSPLHTGSDLTGYVRTPRYRTLAKCTALTGAGCLDAISLSMHSTLRYRFFLEVLGLSWGDNILFLTKPLRIVKRIVGIVEDFVGFEVERSLMWLIYRLPLIIVWVFIHFLLISAKHEADTTHSHVGCDKAKRLFVFAWSIMLFVIFLSFHSYCRAFRWISISPALRQLVHQATNFTHESLCPPLVLYVTDGGVADCTTLVQLVRRQCRRILLVLAPMDGDDQLNVLRSTIDLIETEKLGTVYDPKFTGVPDQNIAQDLSAGSVNSLFDRFKANTSMTHMHLRIRYGWNNGTRYGGDGDIFVVSNRLPTMSNHIVDEDCTPLKPLLQKSTFERHAAEESDEEGPNEEGDWKTPFRRLGGFCCYGCCHGTCDCGTKWPKLPGTGYLWLTPQNFNGLCRWGHELSAAAVREISGIHDLCTRRRPERGDKVVRVGGREVRKDGWFLAAGAEAEVAALMPYADVESSDNDFDLSNTCFTLINSEQKESGRLYTRNYRFVTFDKY